MSEDNTTDGFKIICEVCGSDDCEIEQVSPPYWDDGYRIVCNHCKGGMRYEASTCNGTARWVITRN
jgi:hypothetical protein